MGPSLADIHSELRGLNIWLTQKGICDVSHFPKKYNSNGLSCLGFENDDRIRSLLSVNVEYEEAYNKMLELGAYSFLLLDGAICQLSFCFDGNKLVKHRLGFFSSPHIDCYQNDPDVYNQEVMFSEVVSKNIVPFPFRFDYDVSLVSDDTHPLSHLTLGQYKGCRIAVSAPLTPYQFMRFVLVNFYNTYWRSAKDDYPQSAHRFDETIRSSEVENLHVHLGRLP